jgi:hypothetical protein
MARAATTSTTRLTSHKRGALHVHGPTGLRSGDSDAQASESWGLAAGTLVGELHDDDAEEILDGGEVVTVACIERKTSGEGGCGDEEIDRSRSSRRGA